MTGLFRRAAYVTPLLVIVALMLAGCDGSLAVVQPTQTPIVVTATWGPTPTQETVTPDASAYGQVINANPELQWGVVDYFLPSVDGRHQCEPAQYNIQWWPGLEYQTPPWINCDPNNSEGGYLLIEVTEIQGTLLYEIPQTFSWHADRCYAINVLGISGVREKNGGSYANIAFVAYLGKRDGTGYAPLGRYPVTPLGPFDAYWYLAYSDEPFELYVGVTMDYASYVGSIRLERVTVKERPMRECADAPAI